MVEIGRFEQALRRWPRLEQRCFTARERAYSRRCRRPGQHLAARFAAKEAVAKALHQPARFSEIEVVGEGGAPGIVLHGKTAAAAAGRAVLISISHSGDLAIAVAAVAAEGARP